MASNRELTPLVSEPREEPGVEHKAWLNLKSTEHRATLAKAAIAIANHGGGFIVIEMSDRAGKLLSEPSPTEFPPITQDDVNAAIGRFADPAFHCETHIIEHPQTSVQHTVISVPGNVSVPVMAKRDCNGVLAKHRCYIRKPGPRSEEPQTGEEWRHLLDRCLRARKLDMLDAIRAIVLGQAQSNNEVPGAHDLLEAYCDNSHSRWQRLVEELPERAGARLSFGWYEMGFSLVDAQLATNCTQLNERLNNAREIQLTGWPPFLDLRIPGRDPYVHKDGVEAWLGRPVDNAREYDPIDCDFWRASRDGQLYTIRGYTEDSPEMHRGIEPGKKMDLTLPVWRIAEGLLFANRLGAAFGGAELITIRCRFVGLEDRGLVSLLGRRILPIPRVCKTSRVTIIGQATPQQIEDTFVEVLHGLLVPFYECFDFFKLPLQLVGEEVEKLRAGR